jgi:hypothetical protein
MSSSIPKHQRAGPTAFGASRRGLAILPDIGLAPARQALLDRAMANAQGSAPWRARKKAEARDLLALEELAPPGRLLVQDLDAREGLRALILLDVPVGCRPQPDGPLVVERGAVVGIHYPQEALYRPLPGPSLIQLLAPRNAFHANVSPGASQHLCLGATLPPGVRVKELVLMTYGALSMQSVMIDVADPAGVLNPEAAEWWQQNRDRIPLTPVPFLGLEPSEDE